MTDLPDSDNPRVPVIRGQIRGEKVFDRYQLVRLLGRNALGIVWQATDLRLEREVVLKFLPDSIAHDQESIGKVRQALRHCICLKHPGIVRIYEFLEDGHHTALSMEYVDGETLVARRSRCTLGIVDVEDLSRWMKQLMHALAYAHTEEGIVHGDVRPLNLLLDREEVLKIADFGISSSIRYLARGEWASSSLGHETAYMSPQLLEGSAPAFADDIYSVGATIYELLTSRPPFPDADIQQIKSEVPPPMAKRQLELGILAPSIPGHWEQAVEQCLAKDPGSRPSSAADLARLLQITPPPVGAAPVVHSSALGRGMPTEGSKVRSPVIWTGVVLAALLLLILAGLSGKWWFFSEPDQSPEKTPSPEVTTQPAEPTRVLEPVPPVAAKKVDVANVKRQLLDQLSALEKAPSYQGRMQLISSLEEAQSQVDFEIEFVDDFQFRLKSILVVLQVPEEFESIQNAMEASRSGDTIQVGPGSYREALVFKNGVTLKGAGLGQTRVVWRSIDGQRVPLLIENCERGSIEGIEFLCEGDATRLEEVPAIEVKSSSVNLKEVAGTSQVGPGVRVTGVGFTTIMDSVWKNNREQGIDILDPGNKTEVSGNRCEANALGGILIARGAKPHVKQNTCTDNGVGGIIVLGSGTKPAIVQNVCSRNRMHGIFITKGAGETVEENQCVANQQNGIMVSEEASSPTLLGNRCEENGQHGIHFSNGAAGVSERNLCERNQGAGVLLSGEGTRPTIRFTTSIGNQKSGFWKQKGAEPNQAYGNESENNGEEDNFKGPAVNSDVAQSGNMPETIYPL